MADTELQQLAKTDRNPIQETRYRQLLAEQQANDPVLQQQKAQTELLNRQKAEQSAFLGRYTTGLNDARTALNTELGLPQLRETTQLAGQTARGVSRQVQDIPQQQQTIAKQVGISAPRLALRTSAETAKLQPAAESARRALEDATSAQQFGETQYTQRLQEFTQPFALEASMLSESLAREFTGFTNQMQSELQMRLEKIRQEGAVDLANIQRATELAKAEQEYLNKRETIDLGNRTALINPNTGQEISSYNKGKLVGVGENNNPANID